MTLFIILSYDLSARNENTIYFHSNRNSTSRCLPLDIPTTQAASILSTFPNYTSLQTSTYESPPLTSVKLQLSHIRFHSRILRWHHKHWEIQNFQERIHPENCKRRSWHNKHYFVVLYWRHDANSTLTNACAIPYIYHNNEHIQVQYLHLVRTEMLWCLIDYTILVSLKIHVHLWQEVLTNHVPYSHRQHTPTFKALYHYLCFQYNILIRL